MKLAQALTLRKQIKMQLDTLASRAQRNAFRSPDYTGKLPPQLGDPAEDVRNLVAASNKLERMVNAINAANQATTLESGMTLSQALVQRDAYIQLSELLTRACSVRSVPAGVLDMDVPTVEKMANNYARLARELDDQIQQTNWNTDIAIS